MDADLVHSIAIREVTPLSDKDCFYIVDRTKTHFTYPIHAHEEYELNFVIDAKGARRIVGEYTETIGDYDLVLLANKELEHTWEQGDCVSKNIREITVQFSSNLFFSNLLGKRQFESIYEMIKLANMGISFPLDAIMNVYPLLDKLADEQKSFRGVILFLSILFELSQFNQQAKIIASSPFVDIEGGSDDYRIQKIQKYISDNYKHEIRLDQLAKIAEMNPTAFSRFFKLRTGKVLSDYILDVRLNHAAQMLTSTARSVSEISYDCGFHNLSNFNRLFKKKKKCSPKELRANHKKNIAL